MKGENKKYRRDRIAAQDTNGELEEGRITAEEAKLRVIIEA